jgi:hypothetical protein
LALGIFELIMDNVGLFGGLALNGRKTIIDGLACLNTLFMMGVSQMLVIDIRLLFSFRLLHNNKIKYY